MTEIEDFVQLRADGNRVPAGMSVNEMLALEWGPSKVYAFEWKVGDRVVRREGPYGLHGIVVPGASFIAAIAELKESGNDSQLEIIEPHGSVAGVMENELTFAGKMLNGTYCWFEPPINPSMNRFGVVFQSREEGAFRCDVDAADLRVAAIVPIR